MNWWTKGLRLFATPGLEAPAEMPAANDPENGDPETELDQLRREVYEQRIRITGLSKKLRAAQTSLSTLKVRWPAIHLQLFPNPLAVKRKKR